MDNFAFFKNIQEWSDQYPWLEMLTSLSILLFFAFLANFIANEIQSKKILKISDTVKFDKIDNSIYLRRIGSPNLITNLHETDLKHSGYFQLIRHREICGLFE